MRIYQVATAALIILIAAIAMYDTRAGAIPEAGARNLPAGWYPFWASALMVACAALVAVRAYLAGPSNEQAVFQGRTSLIALAKLVLPTAAAVVSMLWLGLYVVTAVYMAYFMQVLARYRPLPTLLTALAVPTFIFFLFERGFRVPLPKSLLYLQGIVPF